MKDEYIIRRRNLLISERQLLKEMNNMNIMDDDDFELDERFCANCGLPLEDGRQKLLKIKYCLRSFCVSDRSIKRSLKKAKKQEWFKCLKKNRQKQN